jgi:hypothetical protein
MEVGVAYSRRVGGVALAFVAVAAFAAGCGSDSGSSSGTPTPQATDYLSCLRNNGVNVPQMNGSGRPNGNGSGRPSFDPSNRPTAFPSGRPRPSGSGGPSGGNFPGGGNRGGGLFGSTAPSGISQDTWDKARKACQPLEPSGGFGRGNGNGNNGGGAGAAYRNCLTEHGVTVSGPIDQLNQSDPKVAAAASACAVLRPNPSSSN